MKRASAGLKRRVVDLTAAIRFADFARNRGLRIVTTNGAFDLLHVGHVKSLERAKKCGDLLIVGVNSDASVRRSKGVKRPIVPERERAATVAALRSVDYVFIFNSDTPESWISRIRPHVHAKGSDRRMDQIVEKACVEKYGGRLVRLPHPGNPSTTKLIRKVLRTHRVK